MPIMGNLLMPYKGNSAFIKQCPIRAYAKTATYAFIGHAYSRQSLQEHCPYRAYPLKTLPNKGTIPEDERITITQKEYCPL